MLKEKIGCMPIIFIYGAGLLFIWKLTYEVLPYFPFLIEWGGYVCAPFVTAILWGYIVLYFVEKENKESEV